nr:MAG TPA: hypothetical protein [Caudoviricetes sp.]
MENHSIAHNFISFTKNFIKTIDRMKLVKYI